jgi:hypothetical protein
MNNTGGTVDVWEVSGVAARELVESPEGHSYLARPVTPSDLRLVMKDLAGGWDSTPASSA